MTLTLVTFCYPCTSPGHNVIQDYYKKPTLHKTAVTAKPNTNYSICSRWIMRQMLHKLHATYDGAAIK
jgi:hypothetical protein